MAKEHKRRVVITGLGPVTPIGIGKEAFWLSLSEGRSNYSEITRFQLQDYDKTRIAAQIPDFDSRQYVDEHIIEGITHLGAKNGGLSICYGVAAAKIALEDSQLELIRENRHQIGVIMGSGQGDLALLQRAQTDFTHGTYSLANALPGIVAKQLNLEGLTQAISGACATGNLALRSGYQEICYGNYDLMLVGSSEAPIDVPHYMGSEKHRREGVKGLSQKNDLKRGMIPFDNERDGIVLSEGAGVLVLEELEHAQKRKAHVYAEILGYGECTEFDTNLVRITDTGYRRSMQRALLKNDSETSLIHGSKYGGPTKYTYVNAHGTATLLNDSLESKAISELFDKNVSVSSFKGTLGHSQAAAPAIELIGCCLVMDRRIIPSTNLRNVSGDCAELSYVTQKRHQRVDYIMKNSAGFNGIYSSILLGRYSHE